MDWRERKDETLERWTALWEGRRLDRPLVEVTAPAETKTQMPRADSGEALFLDPDFAAARIEAQLEGTYWGGEVIPSFTLLGGWTATSYCATPQFTDRTIWFDPVEIDYEDPAFFDLDLSNPWFRRYEAVHRRMVELAGRDRFMTGEVVLLPGNDMLSLLMGTNNFLMALLDRPAWMRSTIEKLARQWCAVQDYFLEINRASNAFWYGVAGWAPFWGPEVFAATQSDVSCMIGPDAFAEFIMPELDIVGEHYGRMWYHLDGPGAIPHLDALLSREYMRVIQWVPGAGAAPNGPEWIDLYRRIQDAGRVVMAGIRPQDAEEVVKALDPARLCLQVRAGSEKEAKEFIEDARRWTRAGRGAGASATR
jgi:hypothetical protein